MLSDHINFSRPDRDYITSDLILPRHDVIIITSTDRYATLVTDLGERIEIGAGDYTLYPVLAPNSVINIIHIGTYRIRSYSADCSLSEINYLVKKQNRERPDSSNQVETYQDGYISGHVTRPREKRQTELDPNTKLKRSSQD